jgi:hypothetical protein
MAGSQLRNAFLVLMVVLAAACGSTGDTGTKRPPSIEQPDIDVTLAHSLFFGGGTTAPATVDVTVTNRASVPITVRRIEIDSPNMTQYALRRAVRDFKDVIDPGQSKTLSVFSTAETTVRRPSEPLTLRALVELEAGEIRWREFVTVLGRESAGY